MNPTAEHLARLELDVDIRIADVWVKAAPAFPEKMHHLLGGFIRSAYAKGYADAAAGDVSLYTDNGYETPRQRTGGVA